MITDADARTPCRTLWLLVVSGSDPGNRSDCLPAYVRWTVTKRPLLRARSGEQLDHEYSANVLARAGTVTALHAIQVVDVRGGLRERIRQVGSCVEVVLNQGQSYGPRLSVPFRSLARAGCAGMSGRRGRRRRRLPIAMPPHSRLDVADVEHRG